jgi:hypothetical protein
MNRRTGFTAAALLLAATPAWAGMDARNYVARRLAADHHIQVETSGLEDLNGTCTLHGRVVRAFAGRPERLAAGTAIAFTLPCAADSFWPAEKLKSARVLEVFLKSGPAGLDAADEGEGMRAIDAATDAPVIKDDPAVVREMSLAMAGYSIEAEAKRGNPDAALALARVEDPILRLRLLAHAAGSFAGKRMAAADATGDEALAAYQALPAGSERLEAGLAAMESLALGGARAHALRLADLLAPEVDALTLPSRRDTALLSLYGARIRSDDPAAALAALAKVGNPKTRRERLDDMPFAQKDFGPTNPQSLAWLDRLLAAAEAQADPDFRREALVALCRTAYRSAAGLAEIPDLASRAAAMAELAARRRHAPSAVLLAVLREMAGGPNGRAEAARWHAVSASGFDAPASLRSEALRVLATFTPAERAAAAHLLGGSSSGKIMPQKLIELAEKAQPGTATP